MEDPVPDDTKAAGATRDASEVEDLSAEIVKTVPRETDEQVTCKRIIRNHYRVNWWRPEGLTRYDNPGMQGLLVTTNRICKSWFMHVTKDEGGKLEMTVLTGAALPTQRGRL
jgi:hypothetical protein